MIIISDLDFLGVWLFGLILIEGGFGDGFEEVVLFMEKLIKVLFRKFRDFLFF